MISLIKKLACAAAGVCSLAAAGTPIVSTTIDFLDYVFADADFVEKPVAEQPEYFSLDLYERRIREVAESGIKRIYLRVNICGLTHYPSKLCGMYGSEVGGHFFGWPENAKRMENTYRHYDVLNETIRLGKKYGLEVWAWENLNDDAATVACELNSRSLRKYGPYPLMSLFQRQNPQFNSMLNPNIEGLSADEFVRLNREADGRRIGKIVFSSERDCDNPGRVAKENLLIFTSGDGIDFKPYTGKFKFTATRDGKRNGFIVDGLDINARFVKFGFKDIPADNNFTLVLQSPRGVQKVYDTDGKLIPSVWGSDAVSLELSFNYDRAPDAGGRGLEYSVYAYGGGAAVDHGKRGIGFALGEPQRYPLRYYRYGMTEFTIPQAMDYKVERFRELAAYPFDGFVFSSRTHTYLTGGPAADDYGYNPEIREAFIKKFGKDIWSKDFKDQRQLLEYRATGIDDFFRRCKELSGSRPIHAAVPRSVWNKEKETDPFDNPLGSMPMNWEKWVASGSIDGLVMQSWPVFLGQKFDDPGVEFFAAARRKGLKFKVSRFFELERHGSVSPEEFRKNLRAALNDPGLDEVELYETLGLTNSPAHLKVIREELDRIQRKGDDSK